MGTAACASTTADIAAKNTMPHASFLMDIASSSKYWKILPKYAEIANPHPSHEQAENKQ
jgi:hypothetical protein